MQAFNPTSRSGINISSPLRCQRTGPPIINQFHNNANIVVSGELSFFVEIGPIIVK